MASKGHNVKGNIYYCVKVWLTASEVVKYSALAEKAGVRPINSEPFIQKPHGFADEKLANLKGISKLFKKSADEWGVIELDKLKRRAELQKQLAELEKM